MSQDQKKCPQCGEPIPSSDESRLASKLCLHCGARFQASESSDERLDLGMDPSMNEEVGVWSGYVTLQLAPQAEMREVRRVVAETTEAIDARDQLKKAQSRFALDLLLYPLWPSEEQIDGPS